MNVKRITTLLWNRLENYGIRINSQDEREDEVLLSFYFQSISCKIALAQSAAPKVSYTVGEHKQISFTDKLKTEKELVSDIVSDLLQLVGKTEEALGRIRKKKEQILSLHRIGIRDTSCGRIPQYRDLDRNHLYEIYPDGTKFRFAILPLERAAEEELQWIKHPSSTHWREL